MTLQADLAEIQRLGFVWQMSGHANGRCWLSTWVDGIDADHPKAQWMHDSGEDPAALARTRLAQIRGAADRPCTRWNVWSKANDGLGWQVANSNLNAEQAQAALARRRRGVSDFDYEFVVLPVGQVPGGPPVTASDALVFLNPDPEVQPITGPTDAEEAALARADHERERMASEGEEA